MCVAQILVLIVFWEKVCRKNINWIIDQQRIKPVNSGGSGARQLAGTQVSLVSPWQGRSCVKRVSKSCFSNAAVLNSFRKSCLLDAAGLKGSVNPVLEMQLY